MPESGRFAALGAARREVATALAAAMAQGVEQQRKLLGVGGPLLERAAAANAHLVGSPAVAAHARYRGVVHDHLDVGSLGPSERRRAYGSVVIVSALLGAVALTDPVPDYKLKMGASLPGLGSVARFWSSLLPGVLDAAGRRGETLDLLPNEHSAAWQPLGPRVTRVRFDQPAAEGGRARAVGHGAKAVKGILARYVLEHPGKLHDVLPEFTWEGWTFDPSGSRRSSRTDEGLLVFLAPA
ncbi:MAG: hypothetical protein JWL73_385 [Actinomycetia bacterium]|nr:hypothetical protein [Actinomycetes bacterium]